MRSVHLRATKQQLQQPKRLYRMSTIFIGTFLSLILGRLALTSNNKLMVDYYYNFMSNININGVSDGSVGGVRGIHNNSYNVGFKCDDLIVTGSKPETNASATGKVTAATSSESASDVIDTLSVVGPVESDRATATTKRWAVMMIGGARTYAFTRDSFQRNVIGQLPTGSEMDIFTYTFLPPPMKTTDAEQKSRGDDSVDSNSSGSSKSNTTKTNSDMDSSYTTCYIDTLGTHHLELDSTVFYVDKGANIGGGVEVATRDRFERQQNQLVDIIEEYARTRNITYDYVLYTRPDLLFTTPTNMALLEEELDTKEQGQKVEWLDNHTSTSIKTGPRWYSPKCAHFGGFNDRIAAARFTDFVQMVRLTTAWYDATDGDKAQRPRVGEAAFQDRAVFANMSNVFDLPVGSISTATLRLKDMQLACQGMDAAQTQVSDWPSAICHYSTHKTWNIVRPPFMNHPLPSMACQLLNQSYCPAPFFKNFG